MRLKTYGDFTNEEINLKKTIIGGAIGASAFIPSNTLASEPDKPINTKDTIIVPTDKSRTDELIAFVDSIGSERPNIFVTGALRDGQRLTMQSFEHLSYLENKLNEYKMKNGTELNLDLLSTNNATLPFRVNYFFVRGLDNIDGPFLIRILNINFTEAVSIAGHEVMFNFTKVQNVNTFGASINF
jgi:hypothetical protein